MININDFNVEDLRRLQEDLKGKMPDIDNMMDKVKDFKKSIEDMSNIKKSKMVVINGSQKNVNLLADKSIKILFYNEAEAEQYYDSIQDTTHKKTFFERIRQWLK